MGNNDLTAAANMDIKLHPVNQGVVRTLAERKHCVLRVFLTEPPVTEHKDLAILLQFQEQAVHHFLSSNEISLTRPFSRLSVISGVGASRPSDPLSESPSDVQ